MKSLMVLVMLTIALQTEAQFSSASLQASGLTCSMCSKAVKVALEKVTFVKDVKVDIKKQEYTMKFKDEMEVDFDVLRKAVEDAGFSVASLRVTTKFEDVTIGKDKHLQIGGKSFHFLNGKNQVLNGERTISIVDKDFVPAKAFKKFSASSGMQCVQTGKAASCCEKGGIPANARVYHVTI